MKRKALIVFLLLLPAFYGSLPVQAQVRQKESLNSGWKFVLNDNPDIHSILAAEKSMQTVHLPHTWNHLDIIDDTPGYHQGIGWYCKELFIPEAYRNKHLEIFFEGVSNKAEVFINHQKAGTHNGGFTGFRINLTPYVQWNAVNRIVVKADNSKHLQDSIPPFSGDFNLMGGIYRDAWLVITGPVHFSGPHGSTGIQFKTPVVSEQSAAFQITTFIKGATNRFNGFIACRLLYGNNTVWSGEKRLRSFAGDSVEWSGNIGQPRLWSPEHPNLYRLQVQLKNDKNEWLDELVLPVGFKWVGISKDQEFMLNGKPYKLKGASRHQDYHLIGNALPDAVHESDMHLMKEMGCNFIRIAHYPQDPTVYEACNRIGLIAWNEIPVVDKVVAGEPFFRNSAVMMQEMIRQNINNPCIAIWGYHNEVRNLDASSVAHARMLDSIARSLDPQRLTAMALESNTDAPYFQNPLLQSMLDIPSIIGYNVYQGWYRGTLEEVDAFLDTLHRFHPSKPVLLSEYGAGSSIHIHTYTPTIFDFSEEYQSLFQEAYLKAGNKRKWMIGYGIWNFIDFQRDGREDVQPNINNKGMVTTDRKPKDAYYYYKAQWSDRPFVYIAGKHWDKRVVLSLSESGAEIPVTVYSNQKELTLWHNGKEVGKQSSGVGKFLWKIPVYYGNNQLLCTTGDHRYADEMVLTVHHIDTSFKQAYPFDRLCFNTGQSRTFYEDPLTQEIWMPDQPHSNGRWGYVGGSVYNTWPSAAWNGIREGIHKPILHTANEPLFQTFVEGVTAWKIRVPEGYYRITLLLCEPFTGEQRKNKERIFDIQVNGQQWVQQLNMEKEYGIRSAVVLHKDVPVTSGEGITISFHPKSGNTILNGVRIQKL